MGPAGHFDDLALGIYVQVVVPRVGVGLQKAMEWF
jgi:hypothetical protein